MAAEHCAKGLHTKVLGRLAKLEGPSCSTGDIRRALSGSLCDLNGELIQSQPGLEGCGAAVALVAGRTVFLAVAGQSGATLCGQDPRASAEASAAASREGAKRKWTGSQVRALNPEAVAAAARRASGLPEPAPVAGARPARAASIQRLQAKNPTRRLGSSAASAGLFGGKKAGALDPTAVKNAQSVAVDKGAGAASSQPTTCASRSWRCPPTTTRCCCSATRPCTGAASRWSWRWRPPPTRATRRPRAPRRPSWRTATWCTRRRTTRRGCRTSGPTATRWSACPSPWCGERAPAARPEARAGSGEGARALAALGGRARQARADGGAWPGGEAAMKATMSAFYAEQAKRQKLDRGKRDEPTAIGPLTAEGSATQLKHVGEGKIFGMADLDGTSQWRVRMAKATHMRGGDDDEIQRPAARARRARARRARARARRARPRARAAIQTTKACATPATRPRRATSRAAARTPPLHRARAPVGGVFRAPSSSGCWDRLFAESALMLALNRACPSTGGMFRTSP
ncbi:unnamed protein product, partial [Prorocentrum cordatum]